MFEAAVHTVRAWFGRNATCSGKLLLKLDFANAFNTISRQQVFEAACTTFLASHASWAGVTAGRQPSSSGPPPLRSLPVAAGGPLLFSAALQALAQELCSMTGLDFFFLDDGIIAGDALAVVHALQLVKRCAPASGLQLNLAKCDVVGAGLLSESAIAHLLPQELLREPDGSSRFRQSFVLLGAAIREDSFVAATPHQRSGQGCRSAF